jgi:hypothetical protein
MHELATFPAGAFDDCVDPWEPGRQARHLREAQTETTKDLPALGFFGSKGVDGLVDRSFLGCSSAATSGQSRHFLRFSRIPQRFCEFLPCSASCHSLRSLPPIQDGFLGRLVRQPKLAGNR